MTYYWSTWNVRRGKARKPIRTASSGYLRWQHLAGKSSVTRAVSGVEVQRYPSSPCSSAASAAQHTRGHFVVSGGGTCRSATSITSVHAWINT